MKRTFTPLGIAVFTWATFAGGAETPTPIGPSNVGNHINNRGLHESFAAADTMIMLGCSEKLHIPIKDPSGYSEIEVATMKACVHSTTNAIGAAMQAAFASGEIPQIKGGDFAVDQAAAFLRQNSAGARSMDIGQLVREAKAKGRQLRPFKPE